jgi:hypothetical protein
MSNIFVWGNNDATVIAIVLLVAMTACGGGGGRNAVPPEEPVQQPTLPSMEPAAGTLTQTVHYLDNTGCQHFAKNDFFNRRIDRALVSPYSAGKIRYAFARYPHAPVFNAPYRYEVVAAGAPLYPVASRSAHRIPANMQNPHVAGWPVPANMAALLSTADRVSILVQPASLRAQSYMPSAANSLARWRGRADARQHIHSTITSTAGRHAIPMRRHSMTPWCISAWTRAKTGCCWGFYTMVRANAAGYPGTIPPGASAFIRSLRISDFELVTSGTW